MAQSSNYHWEGIQIVELGMLLKTLTFEYKTTVLSNIRTMKVIMVMDLSFVFIVNLDHKLNELVVINALQNIVLFE